MTKVQRILRILQGLVFIAAALIMFEVPKAGPYIVLLIGCVCFLVVGVGRLIFYFTMVRYMVGGRASLYTGIITLDIGLFGMSLSDLPTMSVMLFLVGAYLFVAAVDIMRAWESRQNGAHWRGKMLAGLICLFTAVFCICSIHSIELVVNTFAGGIGYMGIAHICSSFRRTAIVYIE